jgi:hypothetical protein
MKASDEFRDKAFKLCQCANGLQDLESKVEYESLAFVYMCLADQVESESVEWSKCRDLAGEHSHRS